MVALKMMRSLKCWYQISSNNYPTKSITHLYHHIKSIKRIKYSVATHFQLGFPWDGTFRDKKKHQKKVKNFRKKFFSRPVAKCQNSVPSRSVSLQNVKISSKPVPYKDFKLVLTSLDNEETSVPLFRETRLSRPVRNPTSNSTLT